MSKTEGRKRARSFKVFRFLTLSRANFELRPTFSEAVARNFEWLLETRSLSAIYFFILSCTNAIMAEARAGGKSPLLFENPGMPSAKNDLGIGSRVRLKVYV